MTAGPVAPGDEPLRGVVQLLGRSGERIALGVEVPLSRVAAGAEVVALDSPWLEPDPRLAATFGLSELIIGATVVALGTSAPELVVSTVASLEGAEGVAVGNVAGWN